MLSFDKHKRDEPIVAFVFGLATLGVPASLNFDAFLFLHSNWRAGVSIAVGVPVVASQRCGLGEREGLSVVDFGDAGAIASAIRCL